MFHISFTKKDLVRAIWAFLAGAGAYLAVADTSGSWKAVLAGAGTAGLVSLKNLIFADGTTIKG